MQNLPIKLYRNEQIRELDRLAIHEHNIAGFELMTRAGHALFQQLRHSCPNARSFAVLCGSGNNAGDGYIVARLLLKAGLNVCVYALAEPDTLKDDALTAYHQYIACQGPIRLFQIEHDLKVDVIVDGLFGSGLNRAVTGLYAQAIQTMNRSGAFVLAVDIPSGLNADTGNVIGHYAVQANMTVTFIALHQGLFTGQAADYCGEIVYASLAIPDELINTEPASAVRVQQQSLPLRSRCSHKGSNGHVLVIGGEQGYSGAARLAGEAALRVGAGLVSIATRPAHASLINIGRPELMCHGVETVGKLMPLLAKASVIAIGTGLGQSDWASELFSAVLALETPLVVDADALNLLARHPVKNPHWILTPHPAEAARLLNCTTQEVQQDRFASVTTLQAKYQGIAILKGAGTLIASTDEIAISNTGNAGMATGGMGDVLTGVIAGLVAQGLTQKTAAQQGVYLHGKAADYAVKHDGERGLLASDLFDYLRWGVNE
jgi:ADP-dependent NAD(P)H-hydrate dehydratase / NAD(P)H-hydrate epimerase